MINFQFLQRKVIIKQLTILLKNKKLLMRMKNLKDLE
jgi:hypothetical protein